MIVSTTFDISGYRVTRHLGVVRGVTVGPSPLAQRVRRSVGGRGEARARDGGAGGCDVPGYFPGTGAGVGLVFR